MTILFDCHIAFVEITRKLHESFDNLLRNCLALVGRSCIPLAEASLRDDGIEIVSQLRRALKAVLYSLQNLCLLVVF